MSTPTPPPGYLYKIISSTLSPLSPLPQSLEISKMDAQDGFIHLCTSHQIINTLNAFFQAEAYVFILRIPYTLVEKHIKWEDSRGEAAYEANGWDTSHNNNYYPHLYAQDKDVMLGENGLRLGRDQIDQVARWERNGETWMIDGWPFPSDKPSQRNDTVVN
ncbi:unnamed protein product [Blumeria hordei]|uniref:DUF952 domain protein n=1 Tax=Blumeria hordei TaxID=2867405 RepID=A0A383UW38_BLUHO|nr:unnamed protein product [Blumeria hordei]